MDGKRIEFSGSAPAGEATNESTAENANQSGLAGLLGFLAFLATTVGAIWKTVAAFTSSLLSGTPDAAKNYSLGSGDPLERFRRHFASTIVAFQRPVVVVVDDLDRCNQKFVVDLIRGMQTIMVSSRIVYLILGDRDWIEKAFSVAYRDMEGIGVGSEHRFGGRFVEKAVQMSFVLPEMDAERRTEFANALLTLKIRPPASMSRSAWRAHARMRKT